MSQVYLCPLFHNFIANKLSQILLCQFYLFSILRTHLIFIGELKAMLSETYLFSQTAIFFDFHPSYDLPKFSIHLLISIRQMLREPFSILDSRFITSEELSFLFGNMPALGRALVKYRVFPSGARLGAFSSAGLLTVSPKLIGSPHFPFV